VLAATATHGEDIINYFAYNNNIPVPLGTIFKYGLNAALGRSTNPRATFNPITGQPVHGYGGQPNNINLTANPNINIQTHVDLGEVLNGILAEQKIKKEKK